MPETVDHPPATEHDSHLLTVMIADVRGYSKFTHEHGDEAGARLAGTFAALARETVRSAGGSVVEVRGDEVLSVFPSARRAARAAVELQDRCAAAMEADPALPLQIGIGLDAGDIVPVEHGYRGRALNVAARLCALAGPGVTLVGESLVHLAGAVDGLSFVSRGGVDLKGMAAVEVYQLGRADALPATLPPLAPDGRDEGDVDLAAMVVGNVAAGIGVVVVLVDLLVQSISAGMVLRVSIAGLACVAGFAGARLALTKTARGVEVIFAISAIALVLTLGWFGAVSALLFLIAAGLAFFGGHGGAPPTGAPPERA